MLGKMFLLLVFLLFKPNVATDTHLSSLLGDSKQEAQMKDSHQPRRREAPKIKCEQLDEGITIAQVISQPCANIKAKSGNYYFKVYDEPADWASWVEDLRNVGGITFQFTGSTMKAIEFPGLTTVKSSSLTVTNNAKLTSIKVIVSDTFNAAIKITNNPALETVTLSAVKDGLDGGEFIIKYNSLLGKIDMDDIPSLKIGGNFSVKRNPKLEELKMGSITSFEAKDLSIVKNDQLKAINFKATVAIPTITIDQNKNLGNIAITPTSVSTTSLRVRGNPLLSNKVISELRTVQLPSGTADIQEAGECIFDEVIMKLEELDNCKTINSVVNFDNTTNGTISHNKLEKIFGDVYLAELEPNTVTFLSSVTINGTIKSDRCGFELSPHVNISSPPCPTTPSTTTEKPSKATASGNSSALTHTATAATQQDTSFFSSPSSYAVWAGVAVIFALVILGSICCFVKVNDEQSEKPDGKSTLYKKYVSKKKKVTKTARSKMAKKKNRPRGRKPGSQTSVSKSVEVTGSRQTQPAGSGI